MANDMKDAETPGLRVRALPLYCEWDDVVFSRYYLFMRAVYLPCLATGATRSGNFGELRAALRVGDTITCKAFTI